MADYIFATVDWFRQDLGYGFAILDDGSKRSIFIGWDEARLFQVTDGDKPAFTLGGEHRLTNGQVRRVWPPKGGEKIVAGQIVINTRGKTRLAPWGPNSGYQSVMKRMERYPLYKVVFRGIDIWGPSRDLPAMVKELPELLVGVTRKTATVGRTKKQRKQAKLNGDSVPDAPIFMKMADGKWVVCDDPRIVYEAHRKEREAAQASTKPAAAPAPTEPANIALVAEPTAVALEEAIIASSEAANYEVQGN